MFANLFKFMEYLFLGYVDFTVFKSMKLIKYVQCHHILMFHSGLCLWSSVVFKNSITLHNSRILSLNYNENSDNI